MLILVVDLAVLVAVKVAAEALILLLVLRGFVAVAVVGVPVLLLVLENFLVVAVVKAKLQLNT